MKENAPTTYKRLRFVVEVEVSEADWQTIASDKRHQRYPQLYPDAPQMGITLEEHRYLQDAIADLQAGDYTSYCLLPTQKSVYNPATQKYERQPI